MLTVNLPPITPGAPNTVNRAKICSHKLVAKIETYARTFAKYVYNLLNYILLRLNPVFWSATPYHRKSRCCSCVLTRA